MPSLLPQRARARGRHVCGQHVCGSDGRSGLQPRKAWRGGAGLLARLRREAAALASRCSRKAAGRHAGAVPTEHVTAVSARPGCVRRLVWLPV